VLSEQASDVVVEQRSGVASLKACAVDAVAEASGGEGDAGEAEGEEVIGVRL
jgi:hypothetical protein